MPAPVALIGEELSGESGTPFSPIPCGSAAALPVLRLLHHHIYEYRRGVRSLFLMTINRRELELAIGKLDTQGIDHFVQEISAAKVNLFFGRPAFVAVAQTFVTRPLNALSAEEDFMLGTLLGYDGEQQCRRFLTRSSRNTPKPAAIAAE